MPTRRQFLRKAGYGLMLAGGTGWFVTEARAGAKAGPIVPPAPGTTTHGPPRAAPGFRDNRDNPVLNPPPPPPPPGPGGGTTFVANLWDGASGVTPTYFNYGALLPWQNRLGDWTDALGVAQGSAAFASGGSGWRRPVHDGPDYARPMAARKFELRDFPQMFWHWIHSDANKYRSGQAPEAHRYRHQGRHYGMSLRRQRGDQFIDGVSGNR